MRSMLAVFMLLFYASSGATQDQEFRGSVTDDMCGAEHMMEGMNDEQCADECVGMGAAYALYVPAEEKMYLVDDPEKLKPFAGEEVVVKGTVDADGKTLRVSSVAKAEAQ